jgi:hypothetical protein
MLKTIFLVSIFVVLIGFLLWRRTPRLIAFEAVFISVWIFAIAFWITEEIFDKLDSNLLDGFVPYIPPIIPVIIFLVWFLSRAKLVKRK